MCSFFLDQFFGGYPHLKPRAEFAVVAKTDSASLQAFASSKSGWDASRFFSSANCSFNEDFGVSFTPEQMQAHFLEQRALPLPVIRNLTATNVARFMESSWKVPGLEVEVTARRHYPSLAVAPLVGHLKRDNSYVNESIHYSYRLPDYAGKLGLEKEFDGYLRGQPGTRSVLVNNPRGLLDVRAS